MRSGPGFGVWRGPGQSQGTQADGGQGLLAESPASSRTRGGGIAGAEGGGGVGGGDEQVTKLERKPAGFLGSGRWEGPTVGFTVAVGIQVCFKEERQHVFFLNYALDEKRGRRRI